MISLISPLLWAANACGARTGPHNDCGHPRGRGLSRAPGASGSALGSTEMRVAQRCASAVALHHAETAPHAHCILSPSHMRPRDELRAHCAIQQWLGQKARLPQARPQAGSDYRTCGRPRLFCTRSWSSARCRPARAAQRQFNRKRQSFASPCCPGPRRGVRRGWRRERRSRAEPC